MFWPTASWCPSYQPALTARMWVRIPPDDSASLVIEFSHLRLWTQLDRDKPSPCYAACYWSTETKSIILFYVTKFWSGFLCSSRNWNIVPGGICVSHERNLREIRGVCTVCYLLLSTSQRRAQNPQGKGKADTMPWHLAKARKISFQGWWVLLSWRHQERVFQERFLRLGLIGRSLKDGLRGFWRLPDPTGFTLRMRQNLTTSHHLQWALCSNHFLSELLQLAPEWSPCFSPAPLHFIIHEVARVFFSNMSGCN